MSATPGLVSLGHHLFLPTLLVLLALVLVQYILGLRISTWIGRYECIVVSVQHLVVIAGSRQPPKLFRATRCRCSPCPIGEGSNSLILERYGVVTLHPEAIQLMRKEYIDNLVQGIKGGFYLTGPSHG